MRFPKVQSTFGITPYNPERDSDEKRRAIFEHYQSQMGAQPLPPETLPWNKPFPPGVEAQQAFDTMLQERVVDPLARAGYEDLGAGLAAIPSAAHEMIVPQSEFDVGMAMSGMIPKFGKIKGALRTMPERVDETGAAFKTVGKSEFTPLEKPDVTSSFGETLKKPYVEKALDPKEKMWNEILASDPELRNNPDYLRNLRNYFDNRWEQEQGTAVWKMMQFDMPMSERLKPKDEKSVTSGYIDELALKRFAEPYDKIIQAQRLLAKKPGDKPVRTAIIDDKMESYFGNETKSPGRRLQDQMYPKKQMKPELEAGGKVQQPFEKTKKAIKNKPIKFKIIKIADGKDVTDAFGIQENLAGFTQEELQNIVDRTSKKYKVVEEQYVPSGQKNTQGKYYVTDWAGNEIRELGTYDSTEEAFDEITEWLRAKGINDADLDLEVGEFDVRKRKK